MNDNISNAKARLASNNDTLALKVLDLLVAAPKGLTRVQLVSRVFGTAVLPDVTASNEDRAIRRALRRIRNLGVVIIPIPEHGGYRLAGPSDEAAVRRHVLQRLAAAKSNMQTARKIQRAYGLRDVVPMKLSS